MDDWINAINKGGIFGRRSNADRPLVDRSTANEFAEALKSLHGIELSHICDGRDPPDVEAQIGDQTIGLEMVQLMKREVREKKVLAGLGSAYPGQFEQSQWTEAEFERRVNDLLDEKERKYSARPEEWIADALVIHSDEDWLRWHAVQEWLPSATFRPRRKLRSAYLLLTPSPDYPDSHWPLFRLYGSVDAFK